MFDNSSSWQYQVKKSQRSLLTEEELSVSICINDVHVAELDQKSARIFIEKYEWLGNVGAARYSYGLFCKKLLLAVVCFARPTSSQSFKSQLHVVDDLCVYQLCRGATSPIAPKWAGSFLISSALKMLSKQRRVCAVLAYADPRAGEVGIVYQAANALYLGLMDSRGPGQYIINGKSFHPRSVYRTYGTAKHDVLIEVDPFYERIQRTKKHRYIFITAKGARRKLILHALRPHIKTAPKRTMPL